jgi:RNA polymerase sigma-70 factor (ECF subfamily)
MDSLLHAEDMAASPEIETLIEQGKAGDTQAFAALMRYFQSYAQVLALRLLADGEEALEATQDSFVRVWEHLPRYDGRAAFTTWLYTLVTNVCLDRLRARKRQRAKFVPLTEDAATYSSDPGALHDGERLLGDLPLLMHRLSNAQRVVFTLRDMQDLSVDEVRAITGMSATVIKTHLCNARRLLRTALRARYGKEF